LPFAEDEPIPGASEDGTLAREAFAAEVGDISEPLAVRRGLMIWQLAEVRAAGVPPFEEVRAAVEQKLRRQRALELARIEGERLAERWREGADPYELAEEYGSNVTPATGHRRGASIGALGILPGVDRLIFSSEPGSVLEPQMAGERGVLVVKVEDLKLVDSAEIERELDELRSRLMAERAARLMRSILDERRRNTPITIDDELMQRFAPRST
jgi:peptidyl-prolyl cis-trans isomerase D